MRQIIPMTTGALKVQDAIDNFTQIDFSIFASADFRWNERSEEVPLGFGQVGRIRFTDDFRHREQLGGKSRKVSLFQDLHAIPILQIASNLSPIAHLQHK